VPAKNMQTNHPSPNAEKNRVPFLTCLIHNDFYKLAGIAESMTMSANPMTIARVGRIVVTLLTLNLRGSRKNNFTSYVSRK
jgi:hypothetical protein